METRTQRRDLHVVQQSRRDKLRFHQNIPSSSSSSYLGDYSGNSGPNMDLAQLPSCPRYGNVSYDPSVLSSEMLNFGSDNSQSLVAHNNKNDGVTVNQESSRIMDNKQVVVAGDNNIAPFTNFSNHFVNVSGEPQICCEWNNSLNPMGESSSSALIPNGVPVSTTNIVKPGYFKYRQNHFEDMKFSSPLPFHNSIQEVTPGGFDTKMTVLPLQSTGETRVSWLDGRSELHLLPSYGDHSSVLCVNGDDSELVNRAVEGCHQWQIGEFERGSRGALSLSLSSVSPSKSHFGTHNNVSDYSCSSSKQWSKMLENNNAACHQDMAIRNNNNSPLTHLNVAPLGPFTGYATILKSSRFLKPAQQLLDELCSFSGHSALTVSELTKKVLDEVCLSNDAIDEAATGDCSGLSSTLYGSNESYLRPEYQQARVKLLYMQDEICRRYRQYHQQMQMVVSSFESVAGLSAATPYILLALKTVSRNFYSLKGAVSDQLRNIRKILGQELLSHAAGRSKGDRVSSSLKLADHPLEKQRATGSSVGFLDPQTHVWRPQRGLPERAVAVLRAWLFDHFLHPYPTDADKNMLATQTGLTRNQVSNWFINARVRVWKPMVEEIHMLETKAMTTESGKPEVTTATEGLITQPSHGHHLTALAFPNEGHYSSRPSMRGIPGECCSGIGSSPYIGARSHPSSWGAHEKQPRINCHIPAAGMDPPLMRFMPYHQNNLGSVSLTLGLRQSAEGAQQQQQHEPQQLRQQLGGQMIHDYFG